MSYDVTVTLIILVGAVALLVSDRVRADFVALLTAAALAVTGVLTPREAFEGFGSRAAVTILAVGILAEGLHASGVAERAGHVMLRLARATEGGLVAVSMLTAAFASLFMNNIAAAAVVLPAASAAARRAAVAPSRIMLPLAYGTILGGMATLLTSSNLIVSDLLTGAGHQGFGLTSFAPIGIPLVLAGTAYMARWGRRRLPQGGPEVPRRGGAGGGGELRAVYRLGERTRRARVPPGSPLADRTLAESGIREVLGLTVTAVRRGGTLFTNPGAEFRLSAGDVLAVMGRLAEARAPDLAGRLEILGEADPALFGESRDTLVAEAVLAPRSPLIGRTLREIRFSDHFGMTVLAVWRGDRPIRTGIGDLALAVGDALLLQGPRPSLERVRREEELLVLASTEPEHPPTPWRGRTTIAILAISLGLGALRPEAIGAFLLLGGLSMIAFRILPMDRAHRAIDWRAIFLIAGMLPLGSALNETGAAAHLADALVGALGSWGPFALAGALFLLSAALTQVIVGPAVATIMGPVAIHAAQQAGANPRAMAMAVALACSMAFLTPLGHPVNLLVMGPGGYRFADYRRAGWPLAVVIAVVVMIVLPLVFPL